VKPTYRTIVGVRVDSDPREGENQTPLIVVESLEILGGCDYFLIASKAYDRAFRVAVVDVRGARPAFGDGDDWVTRLGGDEKFGGPIRRKLRE
jgi:hypothetical protein